jgi:hypothetical protein
MIAEVLNAYAAAIARVFENRANTVGASEIGQCARKVFFTKNEGDWQLGADRDANYNESWGATLRGRLFEDHCWLPAVRSRYGDKLLLAGSDQKTLLSDFLSATPDGLLIGMPSDALAALGVADIGGDGSLIIECKTIDPRARLDEAKPEHIYQVQVQMGLIGEKTRYRPQSAVISYVNASFFDDIAEFAIRFDPQIYANARKRATLIMTARTPGELPPEGWIAGGRECEFCPFTSACGRLRHAVPAHPMTEAPDPQFVAEIADLARRAKQHRRNAEGATKVLRETEYEIRERLRSHRLRRVVGDGMSVVWSPVKGRDSFDMPAIRAAAEKAGIDISQFVTTGEPTDRLVISIQAPATAAV